MFYSITENSEYVKNKKKFFVVFLFKLILCEFQTYWKSFFIHNINNCLEPRIFVLIDTSRFHYNFVESHIFFFKIPLQYIKEMKEKTFFWQVDAHCAFIYLTLPSSSFFSRQKNMFAKIPNIWVNTNQMGIFVLCVFSVHMNSII